MYSRAVIALLVLHAVAGAARAQPTSLWVDVAPHSGDNDEVEKRYTSELVQQLQSAKDDALLLYTEYTARSGAELKIFLKSMSRFTNETISAMDPRTLESAPTPCRAAFESRLEKITYDAGRAASFSAENHHKFFLGHMIVFRMHLNKSEDYIRKCDKVVQACGISCETSPRVLRWRQLAAAEIHRVRDDMQHSRVSYRDLLAHAHRRLNHLRRQASVRAEEAVDKLHLCAMGEAV